MSAQMSIPFRPTIARRNRSHREVRGLMPAQDERIIGYLEAVRTATSREIAQALCMERTSVTRSLCGLVAREKVDDSGETTCPVTGKRVTLYKPRKV